MAALTDAGFAAATLHSGTEISDARGAGSVRVIEATVRGERGRSQGPPSPRTAPPASRSARGRARGAGRRRRRRPIPSRSPTAPATRWRSVPAGSSAASVGPQAAAAARSAARRSIAARRASAIAGSPAGGSVPSRWAVAGSTARKRRVEATATPSRSGQPISLLAAGLGDDLHDAVRRPPRRRRAGSRRCCRSAGRRSPATPRPRFETRVLVVFTCPLLGQHLGGGAEQPPALVLGDLLRRDAVAAGRQPELRERTALSIGLPWHAAAD